MIKFKKEIMKVQLKPAWLGLFIRELRAGIAQDRGIFYILSQAR